MIFRYQSDLLNPKCPQKDLRKYRIILFVIFYKFIFLQPYRFLLESVQQTYIEFVRRNGELLSESIFRKIVKDSKFIQPMRDSRKETAVCNGFHYYDLYNFKLLTLILSLFFI